MDDLLYLTEADLLARPDSTVLAIVGGGVQGHSHLDAFADLRGWTAIRVASRNPDAAEGLAARHPLATAVASFEDAVRDADVVCDRTAGHRPRPRGGVGRGGAR